MTVSDVRERYINFFAKRGHAIIPSATIVPENDPTTLFTSSGMQPLIPYLLGLPHPEGVRIANSQISFRAEDIEEVGDNRHTTFFEMLGNWSLGDYFKQEQLPWFFEFLTNKEEGLCLDPTKLYVTVFGGDPETGMTPDIESIEIWRKLFNERGITAKFVELDTEGNGAERGMNEDERIFSYGAKKNWWSRAGIPSHMPVGEIGGPDSEVFYDFGFPHNTMFGKKCHPNCDCGRFVEIGNSVFMQFIKKTSGEFGELPKKNVDFGGGLERLTAATQRNPDIFLIDVFATARETLEKYSGKSYHTVTATRSFRIILDHIRAASFFIASGIHSSNTEQGYVLRRLIRRAIREADKLGIKDTVLAKVVEGYGNIYVKQYPFVKHAMTQIKDELEKEEIQFRKTLAYGLRELERMTVIDAFMLFTTYGFPVELTAEIAKERGMLIDLEVVRKQMENHQRVSRAGAAQKFAGGLADHAEETVRYHTAHHLLLKALQIVLGSEVHQRGSNITNKRLRIDFSYGKKITPEQKTQIEKIVNNVITRELPVIRTLMKKEDAEKLGAEHEFGANYPEQVSVYSIGPEDASEINQKFTEAFSIEFCGGPHVSNTRELGANEKKFKIQKEEASSSGVRRIKAVLE